MKKDLVIELLQEIQFSDLSIEDTKSLLNRSEKLLTVLMSNGDFEDNVAIVNCYKNDEAALKALRIYLNISNASDEEVKKFGFSSKQSSIFRILTNQALIDSESVFQCVECFLSIPDEKYVNCYYDVGKVLLDNDLVKNGLNLIFANFIIKNGNNKYIAQYLSKFFTDKNVLKQSDTNIILNRALIMCKKNNNLYSITHFFSVTTIDNEKINLKAAEIIGGCPKNSDDVCNLFIELLPNNLKKYKYYFEAGKIIGTLSETNIYFAKEVIKKDCNFENKNTILLLRILRDCTIKQMSSGFYRIKYGSSYFETIRESVISDIISSIIESNYVYYYMLENSVSKDKNDDINVSDLTNKLVRIKDKASKA